MRVASKWFLCLTLGAAGLGLAGNAHAGLLVSGSVGGAPSGVTKENFDTLAPGNTSTTILPSGITVAFQPDAQPTSGTISGLYAAPFLSGSNGFGFGPLGGNQPDGADATPYLTTGSTGAFGGASVTLTLPGLERYLGLLWGSVDAYNTLSFYNGATLVGVVTGSDVTGSPNGDQGVNGTLYVNINADASSAFDRVVATSGQYAFEFDNVAFNPMPIPEPASLALLGAGLAGLGMVRRRRRA
jgi:hypothetical protein